MSSCCAKCFHCKGPLPEQPITVKLNNEQVKVCSNDCAQTVNGIERAGLTDFYKHRDEASVQPEGKPKPVESWDTYERPAVMKMFVRELSNGDKVADLLVQGVHCAACTWLIENSLSKIAGVKSIEVNPVTTRAELRWDPTKTRLTPLLEEIDRIGYTPLPFTEQQTQAAADQDKRLALRRLLVAGLGMMQVTSYAIAMYAGAFQGMDPNIQEFFRLISLVVATPVVLYSGTPFFIGAWRNLQAKRLGMDVPVALAVGSAWAASVWNTFAGSGEVFFDSATMFVFFLSGTRYLEAAGRYKAFDLTHALAQHIPSTAVRLTQSGHEEIGVMELESGDTVLISQGTAFPADGILLDESTRVDEAMLTGESVPVIRKRGDAVVAGTINTGEATRVQVDRIGADTVLAQIGRLVTQAGSDRPALVQLTDRVASVFVTAVLLIATVTGIVWWQIDAERAFEIVLTVLVVTCPCALALATPAALTVATSTLARHGFLIQRGGALPALANVKHAVFDKTGTLTDNALSIESTTADARIDAATALQLAAALESNSAHPIARAFRLASDIHPASQLTTIAGGGLEGLIDGTRYRIGTLEFATGLANYADSLVAQINPQRRNVFLGDAEGLLARFEIVEKLRDGASEIKSALTDMGIDVTIASGDSTVAVSALASRINVRNWHAEMLPEDKLALVRDLQNDGATIAAVGDGINDSPVLAGADVSIAMGNGTSIAQHSADCVWLGTQLTGIEMAFVTARRTMTIVKQNLVWALCYNVLAIPLAVSGMIVPWMAALGMSLSSLLVMMNALRLGSMQAPSTAKPTAKSCCASTNSLEPAA
jgi:Cu2+-exporting ATPase